MFYFFRLLTKPSLHQDTDYFHITLNVPKTDIFSHKRLFFATNIHKHTMAGIYIHIPFCKTSAVSIAISIPPLAALIRQQYIRALCWTENPQGLSEGKNR